MDERKFKWVEDYTEQFHLDVQSRVRVFYRISRDHDGKVIDTGFSHLRFKTGVRPDGHAEYGPRMGEKDVGIGIVKKLDAQIDKMSKDGDLDEEPTTGAS